MKDGIEIKYTDFTTNNKTIFNPDNFPLEINYYLIDYFDDIIIFNYKWKNRKDMLDNFSIIWIVSLNENDSTSSYTPLENKCYLNGNIDEVLKLDTKCLFKIKSMKIKLTLSDSKNKVDYRLNSIVTNLNPIDPIDTSELPTCSVSYLDPLTNNSYGITNQTHTSIYINTSSQNQIPSYLPINFYYLDKYNMLLELLELTTLSNNTNVYSSSNIPVTKEVIIKYKKSVISITSKIICKMDIRPNLNIDYVDKIVETNNNLDIMIKDLKNLENTNEINQQIKELSTYMNNNVAKLKNETIYSILDIFSFLMKLII